MIATSAIAGHVGRARTRRRRGGRRHQLEHRVLGARARRPSPVQRADAADDDLVGDRGSVRAPVCSRGAGSRIQRPPVCSAAWPRRRSHGRPASGPTSPTCAAASSGRATTSSSSAPATTARSTRPTGPFTSYERARSSDAATATLVETHDATGSSLPWFGWLFALPVALDDRPPAATPAAPTTPPRPHAVVGAARPARRPPAHACSGCSPRRRCRRRSSTRCSPRPSTSPPTTSASATRGIGVAGAVVRAGIVLVAARSPCSPTASGGGGSSSPWPSPPRWSPPLGALRPDVPGPRRHPGGRPPARAGPRLPRRRRRRRGDAAQQPGLRRQRAGDGQRARRRHRRDGAAARRHLGRASWRLVYVVALVWLVVAVDIARRLPETERFERPHVVAPPLDRRRFAVLAGGRPARQPLRRPGQPLPERLPRGRARLLGRARSPSFTLATATPAGIGLIVGGRIADIRGRRRVIAVALPLATALVVRRPTPSAARRCGCRRSLAGVLGGDRLPGARRLPHRAVPDRQPRPGRRAAHRGRAARRHRRPARDGHAARPGLVARQR